MVVMVGHELRLPDGVASPLLRKIRAVLPVSEAEQAAVEALEQGGTPLPPQSRIVADGGPYDGIGIVQAGWMMRSKTLPDGRRQVINFALPGDFLCLDALTFDHAFYDLSTLGRAVVTRRSVSEFEKLCSEFPRLAFAIKRLAVLEEAMLSERLLSVGRRSAVEGVGHLLLELWHRLRRVGLAGDRVMPMPLSQEIIGDALGLSTVHVNRTLKALQDSGLILVDHHRPRSITVLDAPRLERLAGFKSGYLQLTGTVADEPPMRVRANA